LKKNGKPKTFRVGITFYISQMKALIDIPEIDHIITSLIKDRLDSINFESLVKDAIEKKIDAFLQRRLTPQYMLDNFVKDRITRVITTESIKDLGITETDTLSNLEGKIILMLKHSKEFKALVKFTLKNSL